MAALMRITVVLCLAPRQVRETILELPVGATVADALQASGCFSADPPGTPDCGIWGRNVSAQQVLQDLDRVEVYRPLVVDPKVARRARFVRQGVRSSGLFSRRRPGGKAGY